MSFFSVIFSLLFIGLMSLFIYKSIVSIVKNVKDRKLSKQNKGKTIEIDNKKEDK